MHLEELDQGGKSLGSTADFKKKKKTALLHKGWHSGEHWFLEKSKGLVLRKRIIFSPQRTRTKDWQYLTSAVWPHPSFHWPLSASPSLWHLLCVLDRIPQPLPTLSPSSLFIDHRCLHQLHLWFSVPISWALSCTTVFLIVCNLESFLCSALAPGFLRSAREDHDKSVQSGVHGPSLRLFILPFINPLTFP